MSARMPAIKSSVLPSSRSGSISAPAILDQFEARKEIPNLKRRGVRRVRPVRAVVADVGAKVVANSPRRRFFGIGGAHRVAPLGNGAVGFQHQRKNLAGAHEVGKLAEKWPRFVNGVKPARLFFRQPHRLGGHNLESRPVNARENFSLQAATHGVRLDDCKCPLNSHETLPYEFVSVKMTPLPTSMMLQPWSLDPRAFPLSEFLPHSLPRIYPSRFPGH